MTLYILPNLLFEEAKSHSAYFPPAIDQIIQNLDGIIGESEKSTRRYLKRFRPETFREVELQLLNEHTQDTQVQELLTPLKKGEKWGLISDSGLPCMADPGPKLIALANQNNVQVETYPGPCSILYALQLSGLPSQSYTFHGYLPRKEIGLRKKFKTLLHQREYTHIFIEAPYRNQKLFSFLLETLFEKTLLCIACELTTPKQIVRTKTVCEWRRESPPELHKKPVVFLIRD